MGQNRHDDFAVMLLINLTRSGIYFAYLEKYVIASWHYFFNESMNILDHIQKNNNH